MEGAAETRRPIPPLPEYPSQAFIGRLPPSEWQSCLDIWIYGVESRLRLSKDEFCSSIQLLDASEVPFLLSYFNSVSEASAEANNADATRDVRLWKNCYLLLRRLCLESSFFLTYKPVQSYNLLACASDVFWKLPLWPNTLRICFETTPKELTSAYEAGLRSIDQELSSDIPLSPSTFSALGKATKLISVTPEAGIVFLTGADYLETLAESYNGSVVHPPAEKVAKFITEHSFVCLRSLMDGPHLKMSLLLDHLYSLKASADISRQRDSNQRTLLSSLVCLTTFLRQFSAILDVAPNSRGQKLLNLLQEYRETSLHLHINSLVQRNTSNKDKGKVGLDTEMHMHKAAQISQIQDLFPDLSINYILRLLDHYSDNTELVVGALLEPKSLPSHLRHDSKDDQAAFEPELEVPDLAPRPTPPLLPQRKNVFDNDDFDNLRISPAKLHKGRKNMFSSVAETADESSKRKAAIMAALSAFDSDDDERDDAYDVGDVGGAVDNTMDSDERRRHPLEDPNEQLLFTAWKESKDFFARDSKTRISQHRKQLKTDTGWSDEQIEGWGLMLSRDSVRENKLRQRYDYASSFSPNQTAIGRTKWIESKSATATEEEDSDVDPSAAQSSAHGIGPGPKRGLAAVRGAQKWGTGRGRGNTGQLSDENIQKARKRKEQGRGQGGPSHNRREGRAKKMSRGMAGLATS